MKEMIPNKILTEEDKAFIRENSETMWLKLIAQHCQCSEHILEKFIKSENLPVKAKRKPWGSVKKAEPPVVHEPRPKLQFRPEQPPYQFYKPMYL